MTLEELLEQSIALNKEKEEVERKRVELANKQLEINNLIAEEKKKKELEKIQVVIVEEIKNEKIYISTNGTPRTDVLDLLKNTPTRYYDWATTKNEISVNYWNQFKESLEKLPNIELTFSDKHKEYLEKYFNEKLWLVSKSDKFIIIKKAERNKDMYKVQKIPSASWNTMIKAFTVPFSEGWRVIQVLPLSDDVEYTDEVLQLIESQIEQRKKMDEVALKKDADIPNPFINGMELKPFQKAGVYFAMTALGVEIPKPKPKW